MFNEFFKEIHFVYRVGEVIGTQKLLVECEADKLIFVTQSLQD